MHKKSFQSAKRLRGRFIRTVRMYVCMYVKKRPARLKYTVTPCITVAFLPVQRFKKEGGHAWVAMQLNSF